MLKVPWDHTCPNCNIDIYDVMREGALLKAAKNEQFFCPNFKKTLIWEKSASLLILKACVILMFIILFVYLSATFVFGISEEKLLLILVLGAVSGIIGVIMTFRLNLVLANDQ